MRRRSNPISDSEKARRARQRAQLLANVERLLYTRRQTAHALGGVSIATVLRLEARGLLDKVRLAGAPTGAVFHRTEQVRELAKKVENTNAALRAGVAGAGDSAELNRQ